MLASTRPARFPPASWALEPKLGALGEDNDYVFKTVLGVSDAGYERSQREPLTAEDSLSAEGVPC